jgi:TATA-binding protein-associated factor Taf7
MVKIWSVFISHKWNLREIISELRNHLVESKRKSMSILNPLLEDIFVNFCSYYVKTLQTTNDKLPTNKSFYRRRNAQTQIQGY